MSWSLSPARTILSLLMVLPCLAVVITYGGVARLGSHVRLLPLCVIVLAGGMLGLFQLLGPARGPFYLYAITNPESSVGFFANRNHHAVALAASIPMWGAYLASREKPKVGVRDNVAILVWLAIGVTFIFALACESRAGAALALVGVASLPFVLMERAAMGKALRMLWQRPWLIGCVVALVVVGIALAAWSNLQVTAIQRIGQGNSIEELRVKLVPVLWDMASDFFPAGSGAGTFEAVYRHFEPAALLSPQYLNKAHNDLAQVIIEFGLLGVIAVLFLLWLPLSALTKLVRANELTRAGRAEVVGASVAFLSLLAGSLVDYPLRTPAGAVLLTVLGCVIVSAGASRRPR